MFKRTGPRSKKVDLSRMTQPSAMLPPKPLPRLQKVRQDTRKPVWSECTIILPSGDKRIGILLDVSDSGARVRFRTRGNLPRGVRLVVPRLNLKRAATVVWQDTFTAGLHFLN
ncbi:MAG: PilZ domain-containing protein [Henriciella sp.]|nr:PilZ domain-containing protein [Henriciella sp.]